MQYDLPIKPYTFDLLKWPVCSNGLANYLQMYDEQPYGPDAPCNGMLCTAQTDANLSSPIGHLIMCYRRAVEVELIGSSPWDIYDAYNASTLATLWSYNMTMKGSLNPNIATRSNFHRCAARPAPCTCKQAHAIHPYPCPCSQFLQIFSSDGATCS